jgi:hypothetical protein
MDKVQILEKHLKLMLKRTKQSYVTIEQMRDTPEYEAVLNALTEIEADIVKNTAVLPIVRESIPVHDIRNKLSPVCNLIAMIGKPECEKYIETEIERSKKAINYLADREVYSL